MRRLPLILIVLIGVGAPAASTLLFYFSPPSASASGGELLSPTAAPASWNLEKGKWTLLSASSADCADDCRRRLCQMRQARLMLPGAYFRLQRAWLIPPGASAPSSMSAASDCGEARAAAFAEGAPRVDVADGVARVEGDRQDLPAPEEGFRRRDYLYVIDPSGLMMMRFPPTADIYAVRRDLKKLLKLSQVRRSVRQNPPQ